MIVVDLEPKWHASLQDSDSALYQNPYKESMLHRDITVNLRTPKHGWPYLKAK